MIFGCEKLNVTQESYDMLMCNIKEFSVVALIPLLIIFGMFFIYAYKKEGRNKIGKGNGNDN